MRTLMRRRIEIEVRRLKRDRAMIGRVQNQLNKNMKELMKQ
jgi:hypothetical protein